MREDYAHIIVVLDASGSMDSIADDVRGSFQTFVKGQRSKDGKTVTDVYQFSDVVERIVRSAGLDDLEKHVAENYSCSGCTALYDGICEAVDEVGAEFAAMPESERPADVILLIVTDGMENASQRFNANDVRERLERQQKQYNWDVVYLANGVDVDATAREMGIVKAKSKRSFEREEVGNVLCEALGSKMEEVFERRLDRASKRVR